MSLKSSLRVYNILLLGGTGTGKTTLINSIANYFTYSTLNEALEVNEPVCVIPSSFELTFEDFTKLEIVQHGFNRKDEENEHHARAGSCTQEPRVYSFYNDENVFNFIDVPGIGDTRGIFQDSKNKNLIAAKIKEYTEIHGILIIFKSTEFRLDTDFKFNLNETLMMLHASAVPNIKFVITNSRGQDYLPGQSRKVLEEYTADLEKTKGIKIEFNESTIFCVDNDTFKFQCCWSKSDKFKVEFESHIERYTESWNISKKRMNNLFKEMRLIQGHNVDLTSSVGEARTIIHCAIGPLATITNLIQRAITPASRQANIEALMNNGNAIKNVVEIEKTLPKTVCTSAKCIEAIPIPGTNQYNFNFKTVCHDECFLRNVPLAKFPEPALEDCQAFDLDGNCFHCGCRFEKHMHLSQKQTQKQTLEKVSDAPMTKLDAEKFMDHFIEVEKKEQTVIISSLVKLSCYLKQNAILEYNNAFEERIRLEIRKEQAALSEGVADTIEVISKLENTLENYKNQMAVIDESIKNGGNKISAAEIKDIMTLLFTLTHNGINIRKMYEAETLQCTDIPVIQSPNFNNVVSYFLKYLPTFDM